MTSPADTLWSLLTNPNVAYLLLVVGLWAGVTSFTAPGTGLPEAAMLICLSLAAIGLARLPVNVAGLALIGLSVVLFVLELKLAAHGAFLLAGAAAFAGGSLFLFRPGPSDASLTVSRWLVAGTSLATIGFFGFALGKVLETRHAPPAHNPDAVIGATGEARTAINGAGSVYVGGELWSASSDEAIAAGEPVIVVKRDGLTLKVSKVK